MSGPSWVTRISQAKPHCKMLPGGRRARGKTQPVSLNESQTAQEQRALIFLLSTPLYQTSCRLLMILDDPHWSAIYDKESPLH